MWWRASPQKWFWGVRASFSCFSLLSRWWIWTCWSCHRDAFIVHLYLLSSTPLMSGVQLDIAINHKLKGRAGAWRWSTSDVKGSDQRGAIYEQLSEVWGDLHKRKPRGFWISHLLHLQVKERYPGPWMGLKQAVVAATSESLMSAWSYWHFTGA